MFMMFIEYMKNRIINLIDHFTLLTQSANLWLGIAGYLVKMFNSQSSAIANQQCVNIMQCI